MNTTVPPASPTVPWLGLPTAVMPRVWPSGSLSLASRVVCVIVSATSSAVVAVSSVATGGSSTAATLTVTSPLTVSVPSVTR